MAQAKHHKRHADFAEPTENFSVWNLSLKSQTEGIRLKVSKKASISPDCLQVANDCLSAWKSFSKFRASKRRSYEILPKNFQLWLLGHSQHFGPISLSVRNEKCIKQYIKTIAYLINRISGAVKSLAERAFVLPRHRFILNGDEI